MSATRVRSLPPDLLVVRTEGTGPADVQEPLLLAVEVQPSALVRRR